MRLRSTTISIVTALSLALPAALGAATFRGRPVDSRWYDGRAVSTTYGAHTCRIRFHGDQVYLRMDGLQIVGVLDDEVIANAHEIVAHDPRRGVDWVLDCFDLGS